MTVSRETAAMKVGNNTFLIERLAQDCSPFQYIRELTQNAFEAIIRNKEITGEYEGQVIWDIDWDQVAKSGIYKLQVSDNGIGMVPSEIEKYINQLSSSTGTQSMEKNFGIGAKITAGYENPQGLVYKSWSTNFPNGVLATLWKDPNSGEYGLKRYQVGDIFQHWGPLNASRPPELSKTGTSVVLLGRELNENTYLRPGQKLKWLISYLNERYFELPDNITLKVREFANENLPSETKTPMGESGSQLRTIKGKKSYLDSYAEKKGILYLSNATAYWYIMPENLNVSGGLWDEKSQVGAIYQNEIYETKRLQEARGALIHFGINYGFKRVILYIKPSLTKMPVIANTSRSALLVDGRPLPWADWQSEFRANMPNEIKQMMDEILAGADTGNYHENIKRKWREVRELFQMRKYRRTDNGNLRVDGFVPGGVMRTTGVEPSPPNVNRPSTGNSGGGAADLYAAFISSSPDASSGQDISNRESNLPNCEWISKLEGTRADDDLEDRAARYNRETNTIYINRDFRGFTAVLDATKSLYPHATEGEVKACVEENIQFQLTEAIMGILSLQGSPEWSSQQVIEAALSEESLTAAAMPRHSMFIQIKRQVGTMVGASRVSS